MKFSRSSFFTNKLSGFLTAASIFLVVTLTACASWDTWFKQGDSPLPIEVQHLGGGQILSFRAHETSVRLYVTGSARKHPLQTGGHVDIQLIGTASNIIAEKKDDINPVRFRPDGSNRYTDSYVVSFPLAEARKATKIRVIYHSGSHA